MPETNIDSIRKGRRRDWESLRDPEERQKEIEAEKEKRRALRFSKSRQRAQQREREQEEWVKARKRTLLLVGGFVVLIGGYAILQWMGQLIYNAATAGKLENAETLALSDRRYYNLEDPYTTLATWRNAWLRQSAVDMVNMRSVRRTRQLQRRMSTAEAIEDLQSRINRGGKLTEQNVAASFDDPEIIHAPRRPGNGDLAVFASQPIASPTGGSERRWIVAFSWENKSRQWKLEEVRQHDLWFERWDRVDDIQPPRSNAGYGGVRQ